VHTPEFVNFTNHVFPVLRDIVGTRISPQMEDNDDNKIRHTVLEIFSRFPTTETLRSIVIDLMTIGLRVLQEDNEENAIIALKIMFDLHKTYRPSLESQVQVCGY
jgi:transformation/transcription domain-associated protein